MNKMNKKMKIKSTIVCNDLFDDLSDENQRLWSELQFARSLIQVLKRMRDCLTDLNSNCLCNQTEKCRQKYTFLDSEYEGLMNNSNPIGRQFTAAQVVSKVKVEPQEVVQPLDVCSTIVPFVESSDHCVNDKVLTTKPLLRTTCITAINGEELMDVKIMSSKANSEDQLIEPLPSASTSGQLIGIEVDTDFIDNNTNNDNTIDNSYLTLTESLFSVKTFDIRQEEDNSGQPFAEEVGDEFLITEIENNDQIRVIYSKTSSSNELSVLGYACNWSECQCVYDSKKDLQLHIKSKHIFGCNKSRVKTSDQSELNSHKNITHINKRIAQTPTQSTGIPERKLSDELLNKQKDWIVLEPLSESDRQSTKKRRRIKRTNVIDSVNSISTEDMANQLLNTRDIIVPLRSVQIDVNKVKSVDLLLGSPQNNYMSKSILNYFSQNLITTPIKDSP